METIINYYNQYDEEPRLMRTKANTLEFETTKYLLEDYIKKNDMILETGAGTGRYSFHYVNEGNYVTATDLVPKHVEIMKNKALERKVNNITIGLANATNLKQYSDKSFVTLATSKVPNLQAVCAFILTKETIYSDARRNSSWPFLFRPQSRLKANSFIYSVKIFHAPSLYALSVVAKKEKPRDS